MSCSGETQYNKEGLLQGMTEGICAKKIISLNLSFSSLSYLHLSLFLHTGQAIDSPLSDIGLQQAEAAGRYLKDVKFSNVFVSDMLRAKQVRCFCFTVGGSDESLDKNQSKPYRVCLFYCLIRAHIWGGKTKTL